MTTSALLTVQDVATELGCEREPVRINRLIARGELTATRLGEGSYRITRDSLDRYIAAGGRDFPGPKFTKEGWLVNTGARHAFEQAVCAALDNARPTDSQLLNDAVGPSARPTLDATVRPNLAVLELCEQPVPASANWGQETQFPNFLQCYLGQRMRDSAKIEVDRRYAGKNKLAGYLERLYDSREFYSLVVGHAVASVTTQSIAWTKTLVPESGPNDRPHAPVLVTFRLPLAELAGPGGSRLFAAAGQAF